MIFLSSGIIHASQRHHVGTRHPSCPTSKTNSCSYAPAPTPTVPLQRRTVGSGGRNVEPWDTRTFRKCTNNDFRTRVQHERRDSVAADSLLVPDDESFLVSADRNNNWGDSQGGVALVYISVHHELVRFIVRPFSESSLWIWERIITDRFRRIPEVPCCFFILGTINRCKCEAAHPGFELYIDRNTRSKRCQRWRYSEDWLRCCPFNSHLEVLA